MGITSLFGAVIVFPSDLAETWDLPENFFIQNNMCFIGVDTPSIFEKFTENPNDKRRRGEKKERLLKGIS